MVTTLPVATAAQGRAGPASYLFTLVAEHEYDLKAKEPHVVIIKTCVFTALNTYYGEHR